MKIHIIHGEKENAHGKGKDLVLKAKSAKTFQKREKNTGNRKSSTLNKLWLNKSPNKLTKEFKI